MGTIIAGGGGFVLNASCERLAGTVLACRLKNRRPLGVYPGRDFQSALLGFGSDTLDAMNRARYTETCLFVISVAIALTGCRAKTTSKELGPYGENSSEYRKVTAADGLGCGYRTSEISSKYSLGEDNQIHLVSSGTLINFHCTDKLGIEEDLELASHKMVQGVIQTKQFGDIRVEGGPTESGAMFMTADQIREMKSYLDR
jgi:hypothetical protein